MAVKFSVIIGTFGDDSWAEMGMGAARKSALRQLHPALEVLNIHDASLKLARNRGAWEAKGDWLVFLDADDTLHPDYLKALALVIFEKRTHPRRNHWLLHPDVQYDDAVPVRPNPHVTDIRDGNWMVIGTAINRETFWQCDGFHSEPAWEDWSLWTRAIGMGAAPVHVPGAIYRARSNPRGRNSTIRHPQRLFADILRANDQWLATQRRNV